jgi:hypothetical protein
LIQFLKEAIQEIKFGFLKFLVGRHIWAMEGHWIGWDGKSRAKNWGSLDFRDFESFNQAFLAKQGWCMLTAPDSLCARVLKVEVLQIWGVFVCGASYTWLSIIHGRAP